jgi:2-polyprenyl-3-methyl-5-hydroxy-6-metoxy-1,4-benzoquinol methylase
MDRLKKIVKTILKPVFKMTANRVSGLEAELRLWDDWLRDKGSKCLDDYRCREYRYRTDPSSPIHGWHRELVDMIAADRVSILDVGAGPVTDLGKIHGSKILSITAVDPLADEYARLIAKYGLEPPVRTRKGAGEHLLELFGKNAFDVVFGQRCIDHAVDPAACVWNMVEVCRVGGIVALAHEENLAENAAYRGLHQWNFSLKDSNLIVSGALYTKNLDEEFRGRLRWAHRRGGGLIRSWCRKLA